MGASGDPQHSYPCHPRPLKPDCWSASMPSAWHGMETTAVWLLLQYAGIPSINSLHSVYNFCDKPWVVSDRKGATGRGNSFIHARGSLNPLWFGGSEEAWSLEVPAYRLLQVKGLADSSLLALIVCPDGSTAQETGNRGIPSNRSDLLPQSQRDGESREGGRREKHHAYCNNIDNGCVAGGMPSESTADTCTWRAMLLCDRAC